MMYKIIRKIMLVALLNLSFVPVRCGEVQKLRYKLMSRRKVIEIIEVFSFISMIVVTSVSLLISMIVLFSLFVGIYNHFEDISIAKVTHVLDYLARWLFCGMLTDIFLFGVVEVSNYLILKMEKEVK